MTSLAMPVHATTTYGGTGGITPLILNLGNRWGKWSA